MKKGAAIFMLSKFKKRFLCLNLKFFLESPLCWSLRLRKVNFTMKIRRSEFIEIIAKNYNKRPDLACFDFVLQHMYGNSAMSRCGICQSSPTDMSDLNNIDGEKFHPNQSTLIHGITPLHAKIQIFNFIKNIGYRKFCAKPKWGVRGDNLKDKMNKRKENIQKAFLEKLSLRVDFPNSNGGTSTNGNVCRRAFQNHEITASILNIDPKIVENLKIILYVISSKKHIKINEFHSFCSETYRMILTKYPWVLISPTVHKVLAHSCEVAESLPLPLGMFGEEGSESRNKIYRHDREHHSRQSSRLKSLTDVFNRAMDSSDPIIANCFTSNFKEKIDETCSETVDRFLVNDEEINLFFAEEDEDEHSTYQIDEENEENDYN
jgi:hypothetical protein